MESYTLGSFTDFTTEEKPTGLVRWVTRGPQATAILQQQWLVMTYRGVIPVQAEHQWRDVPTVEE